MFRADFGHQKPQGMEGIKTAAEFAAQEELTKLTFINSVEKKLIPWRQLLQAFAAGYHGSISHGRRLAAMRTEARLPALEAWKTRRAEETRSGSSFRHEGLTAKGTAPFFQGAEAREERSSLPPQGKQTRKKTSPARPAHRGRPPKTRAA
jgi:hypothetical protein